jgi:ribonuclease HI
MDKVKVYTDGACLGNPGPGGWAWAVSRELFDAGGEKDTTNQRMELTAALKAMERFKENKLLVVSDSQYLVRCFNDGWWKNWIRNSWRNSQRQPVKNQDIWMPLIDLYLNSKPDSIKFEWVKGHSGVDMNEYVDMLATSKAKSVL